MVLCLEHRPPFVSLLCELQILESNLIRLQPYRFKFNQRRGNNYPTTSRGSPDIFSAWVILSHIPTFEPIIVEIVYLGSQTPSLGLRTKAHPVYMN